jgi:hypothetical protein
MLSLKMFGGYFMTLNVRYYDCEKEAKNIHIEILKRDRYKFIHN